MLKEEYLKQEEINSIKHTLPNQSIIKRISDFYYIYSDITRVMIIGALTISELCVNELCEIINVNQTTVSHQLKLLRDAMIVDYRRCGKLLFYRIVNPYVNEVMSVGVKQINLENERYAFR